MSSVAPDTERHTTLRRFNTAPSDFDPERDLPKGFMDFLLPLHRELTPRQQEFIRRRAEVLTASHQGRKPDYLAPSEATAEIGRFSFPPGAPINATR